MSQKRRAELELKQIKTDIHNCVGYIQDPKMLKDQIKVVYQKHVHDDVVSYLNYEDKNINYLKPEINKNL